jgi:tetratricopeptide (TPR) repeat protein
LVPAVDRWVKEGHARTQWQREAIRDFYFNAAWGYTDTENYDSAIELNRKSLELDPRFAMAHVNLGFMYMSSFDLAVAIKHFERAMELDATNPTANNNLGFVTLIHGDFDKAIAYLKRAHELNNYLLVTINLGDAYRYAGNSERALQFHLEARDGIRERGDDEKYMTSHWRYNYMPLAKGDTQTIRRSILVRTKDEKRAFVHYALSFDQALVGDLAAAQRDFDTAVRLAGNPEFRCFFANKIAAIDRFVKVPPRASRWLDERRLELRRGLPCEGS